MVVRPLDGQVVGIQQVMAKNAEWWVVDRRKPVQINELDLPKKILG